MSSPEWIQQLFQRGAEIKASNPRLCGDGLNYAAMESCIGWIGSQLARRVMPSLSAHSNISTMDILSIGAGLAVEAGAWGKLTPGASGKFFAVDYFNDQEKQEDTRAFLAATQGIDPSRLVYVDANVFSNDAPERVFQNKKWPFIMLRNWQFTASFLRPNQEELDREGEMVVAACLDALDLGGLLYISAHIMSDSQRAVRAIRAYEAEHPGAIEYVEEISEDSLPIVDTTAPGAFGSMEDQFSGLIRKV